MGRVPPSVLVPEELVRRVVTLVDRAEYKRHQAPPGVRVIPKAFGKDCRLPHHQHDG